MSYNIYNATTDSLEKVSGRVANGILNTLDEVKESASDNVASGSLAVKELAECNDYSTEEQAIGKWIDGRTIYRKVITTTLPSSTGSDTTVYSFTETIIPIHIYGACIESSGSAEPITFFYSSNNYISIRIQGGKNIKIVVGGGYTNTTKYIVVEYIKA